MLDWKASGAWGKLSVQGPYQSPVGTFKHKHLASIKISQRHSYNLERHQQQQLLLRTTWDILIDYISMVDPSELRIFRGVEYQIISRYTIDALEAQESLFLTE